MKKILFLFIALGILICPSTAIFAKGNEYTEGDLVYIIERGGIIITGYFGDEKTVVIPKSIAGMPVSEIGEKAFTGTYVTKIILPESIMKISEQSIPSNCQVEYESRGQSALEKNNPDKEQSEESENSMSENVPLEVDSGNLTQEDTRKDTDSTAVQDSKTLGLYSGADDKSGHNSSVDDKSKINKNNTEPIIGNTSIYDASESHLERATIDEFEDVLEDNPEDSVVQAIPSEKTNPLKSAHGHESSLESSTVTEEGDPETEGAVRGDNRKNAIDKVLSVIIISGLIVFIVNIMRNKRGKT